MGNFFFSQCKAKLLSYTSKDRVITEKKIDCTFSAICSAERSFSERKK